MTRTAVTLLVGSAAIAVATCWLTWMLCWFWATGQPGLSLGFFVCGIVTASAVGLAGMCVWEGEAR